MKLITNATLIAALSFSAVSFAHDITESSSSKICRSYVLGVNRHIEGPAAKAHAWQAATIWATEKAKHECQPLHMTFDATTVEAYCGLPTDDTPISPFNLRVCVTCDAVAIGTCR